MSTLSLMNSSKPSFLTLSPDLEALVFDFLPLSDYNSLRLVCRNFNFTLRQFPKLWGKHLVQTLLNPSRDLEDILEDDWDDSVPLDLSTNFVFDQMNGSETVIKKYYTAYAQLKMFFEQFLDKESSQELTRNLEDAYKAPNFPFPCLKRDIHFFATKTSFQNFLTEVYFGIQSRVIPTDRKQTLVKEIVEKLRSCDDNDSISEKKLLLLQRNPLSQFRRDEEARVVVEVKDSQEEQTVAKKDEQPMNVLENVRLFSIIEEFYSIIYELVINRCEMVLLALKAVKTPQELLNEYCRQWSKFVLTIIEVNRSLLPFSQFLNELYKRFSKKPENVPEFSVWKLMVKIWQNTLFEPLSDQLYDSFVSLLFAVRQDIKNLDVDALSSQSKKPIDQISDPYASFDLPDLQNDNSRVLRGFYNAVSDLSYDEVTIFYWECTTMSKETPKGVLIDKITDESLRFYEDYHELLIQKPTDMIKLLETDHETLTDIFGKELNIIMRECQFSYVKSSLTKYLVSICDTNVEDSPACDESKTNDLTNESISRNLEHMLNFIGARELLQDRISAKKGLPQMIEEEQQRLFNPLIALLEKINHEMKDQKEKNQEIYCDLVERGFGQGEDEQEEVLFLVMSDQACGYEDEKY